MALPSFLRELDGKDFRRRVKLGVTSGYAVTGALLLLAIFADTYAVLPNANELYAMVLVKLGTNSLQWLAVRRDRWVVWSAIGNTVADIFLITGMVYLTGGPSSSLFPAYLIVIAIVGGLSNAGTTILLAVLMAIAYATMVVLIKVGLLVHHPTISDRLSLGDEPFGWGFVIADVLKVIFFLAVLTGVIASVLNLLRRTEEELKTVNEELRESGRRRDEFFASVTHELKTPIHGVLGMAEIVAEGVYGPVSEEQHGALRGIRQAGNRLLAMVVNLLQFQRSQAGQISVHAEEFDLQETVNEVLDDVSWAAVDREVRVALDVQAASFVSDPGLLRHILGNLLSNALKFSPEHGTVRVAVRREGCALVVSVADEGPGIPDEELQSIFEEWWQVNESARAFGGTGLGLAVVRRMVDALGGTVAVECDGGATFHVQIPESSRS